MKSEYNQLCTQLDKLTQAARTMKIMSHYATKEELSAFAKWDLYIRIKQMREHVDAIVAEFPEVPRPE